MWDVVCSDPAEKCLAKHIGDISHLDNTAKLEALYFGLLTDEKSEAMLTSKVEALLPSKEPCF
eukprot:9732645-Lingulodinium_polyedra.AAC.1